MALTCISVIVLILTVSRSPSFCQGTSISKADDLEVCHTQVCQESAQFLLNSMDVSVDPCDDFYRYACGGWIDKHSIPTDRILNSVFDVLNDEVYHTVAELLKNATSENHPKAVIDAALLFQGCINEGARERRGLDPLRNVLNSLGGWPMVNPQWSNTSYKWYKQVATMSRMFGIQAMVTVDLQEDVTRNSRYTITLREPEFGIETQYLRNETTENTKETIGAYRNYIISTARLLNPDMDETLLQNQANEIIEFESDLAAPAKPVSQNEGKTLKNTWYEELMIFIEFMVTRVRAPQRDLKKVALSDVQRITQNEDFMWTDFLNDVLQGFMEVTDRTEITFDSLSYLRHAIEVVHDTEPRVVANYIGWILLKNVGHHTTKDFRENAIRFQKKVDRSWPENLEKSCVKETASILDFAVGRLYTDKYISEEKMHEVEQLIEDVRSAFEVNLNHNAWMDSSTKERALEKLRHMKTLIGYPPWIKVDSQLDDYYRSVNNMKKDEYFESFLRANGAMEAAKFRNMNQPVYRTNELSPMSILEVDAMYLSNHNAMYFPAAIFNPPIYTPGTVPALNYAGVGSIAAHEITHGFDNQGRLKDKNGNEVNWWSEKTERMFEDKVKCLREQYSEIVEPMTNRSLNPLQTLPDDVADNGAVRNAFMAYRLQVLQAEENQIIKRNTRLPGLSATSEQLYFIGLANMECTRHSEQSMKWILQNDAHSPAEYRVCLPLRNSRAFAEAFNCPLGSPMNPELKCQLW